MRRRAFLSSVTASLIVEAGLAATRPRYGGRIRFQVSGAVPVLDPQAQNLSIRDRTLVSLFAETLVRLNARGEAEAVLATSWRVTPDRKRWRFSLRPDVLFHDGSPLAPSAVASALAPVLKPAEVKALADGVEIGTTDPDLLSRLAAPHCSIVKAGPTPVGTGPFQLSADGVLNAFEQHWAGRAFLDAIELLPPRNSPGAPRSAEIWEMSPGASRRGMPEHLQVWSSRPSELLGIEIANADPNLAAGLSAAIDRTSMTSVLTERRAEPSAALLPEWISGYAFVFTGTRDLARARQSLTGSYTRPLVLSYDTSDGLARIVAERVAVNARDAGLTLVPRPEPAAALRMRRLHVPANGPAALRDLAAELGISDRIASVRTDPESMYTAERSLLDTGKFIPLMHVPLVLGYNQKLHMPPAETAGPLRFPFEELWMAP